MSAGSGDGFSLSRWSRRKLAVAKCEGAQASTASAAPGHAEAKAAASPPVEPAAAGVPAALPPAESLTFDSDFTAFMQPGVDAAVKRAAVKQLFRDPRFNVMDGLDVYIDDYTQADPIPPDMLKALRHARAIFDPPQTMVNAEGHAVDVPRADSPPAPAPPAPERAALPRDAPDVPSSADPGIESAHDGARTAPDADPA